MMSVPCFLVVHPKGTLMWDVGVIPDRHLRPDHAPVSLGYATATTPLKTQLAAIGYKTTDITYLALSHFHYDHVANANDFAGRHVAGAATGARHHVCRSPVGTDRAGQLQCPQV